ncbi:CehA/McbA family metallohydrolase [Candidatus Micrarchaeota archaeon]|nr:CehA/McbA family metallohydrolase [Candidatus Micrarchaeota archaeon]
MGAWKRFLFITPFLAVFFLCSLAFEAAAEYNLYWGDLHAHSNFSDGQGTPAENFAFARDNASLDFYALTDHDGFLVEEKWNAVRGNASLFNEPGRFVAFSGFEWGNRFGHKPVYFKYDNGTMCNSGSTSCDTPEELYQSIANEGEGNALCHAAHPTLAGMETDWTHFNESYQPNVEFTPWYEYGANSVNYALLLGYKVGFIGVSDTHDMRPGTGMLTACYATELTREGILEALKHRRCYVSYSSGRIGMTFDVGGHGMGTEFCLQKNAIATARAEVDVSARILSIEFVKNNVTIGRKTDCSSSNCVYSLDTVINESSYLYSWVVAYNESSKKYPRAFASPVFVTSALIDAGGFDGSTTDLAGADLSNITSLVLEKSAFGKIVFAEGVNLCGGANLSEGVKITQNRIEVVASLPALNKPASLYLCNLAFINPRIMKDGAECPPTECALISYEGGTLAFRVNGFSAYWAEEAACVENWECGEWGACVNGVQRRSCVDSNSCGTDSEKPEEESMCSTSTTVPPTSSTSTTLATTTTLASTSTSPVTTTECSGNETKCVESQVENFVFNCVAGAWTKGVECIRGCTKLGVGGECKPLTNETLLFEYNKTLLQVRELLSNASAAGLNVSAEEEIVKKAILLAESKDHRQAIDLLSKTRASLQEKNSKIQEAKLVGGILQVVGICGTGLLFVFLAYAHLKNKREEKEHELQSRLQLEEEKERSQSVEW